MKVLFVLLVAYGLPVAGFFAAMCQKPAVFASVMARTPNLTFMILPFRPMWVRAVQVAAGSIPGCATARTRASRSPDVPNSTRIVRNTQDLAVPSGRGVDGSVSRRPQGEAGRTAGSTEFA